jgi:TonB family protein
MLRPTRRATMALREKFGRLVLLEETETGPLGREYRAARLGPAGLERLVTVLRFGPEVSNHADGPRRLMEEARLAARLQNPGLVRVLGIGRVEQSFYISTELAEGRPVSAILERCRAEAFPFAAEHALMIASRAASALESLHARKDESGAALVHGLIAPARVLVAFDGEVKLKGLGLWAALRGTDLLPPDERRYLAPEQLAGAAGDPRSDLYALGLVLLESLTGRAPDSPLEGLVGATIMTRNGEAVALPKPLEALLSRTLDADPAGRFASAADFRKSLDALLFSGDFTPTTFDLAFFMHTLFREDMEREARSLEEARRADYREFVAEEKPAAPSTTTVPDAAPAPEPARDTPTEEPAAHEAPREPAPPVPPETAGPAAPEPARLTAFDRPSSSPEVPDTRASAARAREAAARMTLGGAAAPAPASRRGLWLMLGLAGAVLLGGGAGWLFFVGHRGSAASAQPDQTSAAQARVRELEARVAQLEREKTDAVARAAEEARTSLEAQAKAGGRSLDPAVVARAQQEARDRARREQDRKQQEELDRIAAERNAEVQRLGSEATPVPSTTPVAVATPTPTPLAAPAATLPPAPATETGPAGAPSVVSQDVPASPTPAAAPTTGAPAATAPAATAPTATPTPAAGPTNVADPRDPGVKPPVLVSEEQVPYPSRAVSRRISATVVVRALVDAQGRITDVGIVQPSGQPEFGFDEAALKRVKSRRYRPARRHDLPVAMWVIVRIDFRPPGPRF